jgi:hypothetical protein
MLFVFRFSCLFTFHKHKQQSVYILKKKTLKRHQYGYLMKGLGLGSKNMLFIFRFLCFFTFRQHKQLPMVARFFKGYASMEVMQPGRSQRTLFF